MLTSTNAAAARTASCRGARTRDRLLICFPFRRPSPPSTLRNGPFPPMADVSTLIQLTAICQAIRATHGCHQSVIDTTSVNHLFQIQHLLQYLNTTVWRAHDNGRDADTAREQA